MGLQEIKTMSDPFHEIGMRVGDYHTSCPAHGGSDSVSCQRNKNTGHVVWNCKSCGAGGTVIDAWAAYHSATANEAIRMLLEKYGEGTVEYQALNTFDSIRKENVKVIPTSIHLPFDTNKSFIFMDKNTRQKKRISASSAKIWTAPCIVDGDIMAAATLRWDINGEKVVRQAHFSEGRWITKGFPHRPVPLYKEWELSQADKVIFVEGEKCMDALQKAVGKEYVVTTLVGGSKAFNKSNIDALRGKKELIILPDRDDPGLVLAKQLKDELGGKVVLLGDETSKRGYDVADWLEEGNKAEDLFLMSEHMFGEEVEGEEFTFTKAMEVASVVDIEDIDTFFRRVAQLRFNKIQMDRIFQAMKDNLHVSITAIKATYKEIEKEEAIDYPTVVCDKTIETVFRGNVIQHGRVFWIYTGTHWVRAEDEFIKKKLLAIAKRYVPSSEMDAETAMRKAFALIKAKTAVNEDFLGLSKRPKPIINLKNGELHIHGTEWELKPHDPNSRLTYCLEAEYDPDATCPEYDRAIRDIMCGDEELVRHIEEVCGYMVQPVRKFKNFFIWYGQKGHNGKSAVKKLVTALIGDKNVLSVKIHKFGTGNHDENALVGKMLLSDDDLEKGIHLNDGLIKTISEEKMLTANPKGKDTFQFMSYAAILMCSNHWPATRDLTRAMITRANVTPFNAYFAPDNPNTDKELFDRIIKNEISGVLNRYLEGLRRLMKRGRWDYPQACLDSRDDWLRNTNNLFNFMSEVMEPAEGEEVEWTLVRASYLSWCANEGIRPIQNRTLRGYFSELGVEVYQREGDRQWMLRGQRLISGHSEEGV